MSAPIFPTAIVSPAVVVNNANGTTAVTALTAGSNGTRIDKLIATSTDTSAHDVEIILNGNVIGTVSVPAGAGTSSSTPAKDVFADANIPLPFDAFGNKVAYLAASDTLQVQMAVAVTSGKVVSLTALGGNF
jgi:hypothetical protein